MYPLRLSRYDEKNRERDYTYVSSGSPSYQIFKTAAQGQPGSLEPIPEGGYGVGKVEWAGKRDVWSASHGPGLGPFWVGIRPQQSMARGDFGFHMDANYIYAPGSAGCLVFRTEANARVFLSWFTDGKGVPGDLVVNWGRGTVGSLPKVKK